jgi:DNA-directed RNA polymerase specialized sigma24 family protein
MSGLYQLSFLLTAEPARAEHCFVSGLEDCAGANRVFKEWARSWARRTIVQNAIRLMQPTPKQAGTIQNAFANDEVKASNHSDLLGALFGLRVFERFVFVMSVLERYSDQDCKTLLGCSRQDIVRARAQALVRMATIMDTRTQDVAAKARGLFAGPRLLTQTA